MSSVKPWLVVTESASEPGARWLEQGIVSERVVHAVSAGAAAEEALSRCSVLELRRGVTAEVFRVLPKPLGTWRSRYEHPEKDTGPHEHLPDYGKRIVEKLSAENDCSTEEA